MKITQVCPTKDLACGIGIFANNLQAAFERLGLVSNIYDKPESVPECDVCIVHTIKGVEQNMKMPCRKQIGFLHFYSDMVADGYIVMNSKLKADSKKRLLISHPGYVRPIEDRIQLKEKYGLQGKIVIGSNGFINKKRRFVEISKHLLKHPDIVVNLMASKHHAWKHEDIEKELTALRSDRFIWEPKLKTHDELNLQMQMCDLLWCWTDNDQTDYASGVVADQYASGTKLVFSNVVPHHYLHGMPNTIMTGSNLKGFLDKLDEIISLGDFSRHEPCNSWDDIASQILDFLKKQLNTITLV